jgi:hypothetical protein
MIPDDRQSCGILRLPCGGFPNSRRIPVSSVKRIDAVKSELWFPDRVVITHNGHTIKRCENYEEAVNIANFMKRQIKNTLPK